MNDKKSDDSLDDSRLSYVAQFRVHQEFVRAHLNGTLNDEQPLLPAFFPPSSYWTSHEKDLFFHGLAVYSRFRPDLIAESIKTKSTFDVCLYLDILQTASSSVPSQSHGSLRHSLEPAMELSSEWIQNEEKMATALLQFDSCAWTPVFANGKPDKPEYCSPESLPAVGYTGPSYADSSQTGLKQSYLNNLDGTCLMTLEKLAREAHLGEADSALPTPYSCGPSVTQCHSPMEEGLSNLDSSRPPAIESPTMVTSQKSDDSKSKSEYPLMKRLYMRRKRAQFNGRSVDTEAVRLRPGRQTKERKPPKPRPKMYKMKRKIFNSNKESSQEPETVASPEADHIVSVPRPVDGIDEDDAQYEPRSKGGLTKLYQWRSRFLEVGIDSQLVLNNNLDFFHLSSLAQLLRLNGSLNDLTGPLSISADTIQLLVAILKEFISEVVRSFLISKEQEIRLKGTLKVWKYDRERITVENVRQTLKSMKIVHSNLKDYFEELVGGIEDDNNVDGSGDDHDRDSNEHETSDEDTVVDPSNTSNISEEWSPSQTLPESFRRCLLPKQNRVSGNDSDILLEIDEIELGRELKEEEQLDARDLLASTKFEAGLWGS